jgi:hypothetical protein
VVNIDEQDILQCFIKVSLSMTRIASLLYATVSAFAVAFQLALAAGAPWGAYAMGGMFQGQLPSAFRIFELVQAALLIGMAVVVLARAGLVLAGWWQVSQWLVWVVVALAALSLVLNLITPSAGERAIWAPVALLLLTSSALVAITGSTGSRPNDTEIGLSKWRKLRCEFEYPERPPLREVSNTP